MPQAIPVIDLTDFMADQPGALAEAGRQVHHALTEVGFFVLTRVC
jgi:isopenicillin N synthase-like dioxygenase